MMIKSPQVTFTSKQKLFSEKISAETIYNKNNELHKANQQKAVETESEKQSEIFIMDWN